MTKEIIIKPEEVHSLNKWKLKVQKNNQYYPYITIRKVNKVGRRHWIYCRKQKREVHLLSDGELRAYKLLVWNPSVVSVEEQYPLDIDETFDIAIAANMLHPRNWETKEAKVMTTDFLVTERLGDYDAKKIAYTFKYWNQIFERLPDGSIKKIRTRTWQKFAIEREYWRRRGVEYKVITERFATKARAWNIDYFEMAHDIEVSADELKAFGQAFVKSWRLAPRAELQEHLKVVQLELKSSFRRVQSLFQYLGLHQLLPINVDNYIRLFRPLEVKL